MTDEGRIFITVAGALAALLVFSCVRDGTGGHMAWYIWLFIAIGVLMVLFIAAVALILPRRPMTETDERLGRVDQELTERGL